MVMEIKELYENFLESGKISTDTRQITPGSIFFALKGEKFNANTLPDRRLKRVHCIRLSMKKNLQLTIDAYGSEMFWRASKSYRDTTAINLRFLSLD